MRTLSLAVVLCLLAGCARDDAVYPSLAQRPAELRGFAEPATPAPGPIAPDPALDARAATLRASLGKIAAGFDAAAARARAAAGVAGARTVGSDAWLDAQSAVATLDDWRAQASSLAVDADALASDRAAALERPYPTVETLRTNAAAEVARQDAAITAIAGMLPRP